MRKCVSILIAIILWLTILPTAGAQISAVRTVPETALEFNESVLLDILKRDIEAVLEKALPEVQNIENVESELEKYMGYLPDYEEGKQYIPFDTEVRRTEDVKLFEYIYRTRYELTELNIKEQKKNAWAVIDIYSQDTQEGLKFRHYGFRTVPHQPTEVGKFEIKNKSIKHYIFLCLLIAMPIFIIFTIVTIIRNKHMTKKWLWAVFSAFGFWGVNFNWITGKISAEFITITTSAEGASSWHLKLVSIKVLAASVVKTAQYSPFIVTIAFPLGAILYWVFKHRDKTISEAFE